jgi:hypothetical protein
MVVFMQISTLVLAGTLAMSLTMQTEAATHADDTWLLTYQGKTTNQVRWDPRFSSMLQSGLPHYRVRWWGNSTLPDAAFTLLSGPPDFVVVESNRYVTLAAAVAHDAETKGLLWVDTGASQPEMIFAYIDQDPVHLHHVSVTLYIKNSQLIARLPPQFLSALSAWQSNHGITKITEFTVVNAEGKITNLPLAILGSN